MRRPVVALSLATAFGVGFVPFAPGTFGSAVGLIVIAARDERLVSLDFGDCRRRMLAGLAARYGPARLKPARDPFGVSGRINAYLAGDLGAVDDILVDPGGTPLSALVQDLGASMGGDVSGSSLPSVSPLGS